MSYHKKPEESVIRKTVAQMGKGEVPSNVQLEQAILETKETIDQSAREAELNTQGQRLATDAKEILDSAQRMLREKNKEEALQQLVHHTQEAAEETKGAARGIRAPSASDLQGDFQDIYNYAKDLAYYMVRSGEFRDMVTNFISMLQQIIGASEEKLQRVAEAAKADTQREDTGMTWTTEEAKEVGHELKEELEEGKLMTEEQKKEFRENFRILVNKIHNKPESRKMLDKFWRLYYKLSDRAEDIKKSAEALSSSNTWDKIWTDIQHLIDAFAGEGNFEKFTNDSWILVQSIKKDEEANRFLHDFQAFCNKLSDEPELLSEEYTQRELNDFIDRGRKFLGRRKFRDEWNNSINSFQRVLENIKNDEASKDFVSKLQRFASDFAFDSQGRPDLFVIQHSLSQIREMLFPLLRQELTALQVPRIESSDEKYDVVVRDLNLVLGDILPEFFELKTKNLLKVEVRKFETDKTKTKILLRIRQLKPTFKNMKFYYKRKSFPKIEDYGTADVDLAAGDGTTIKVEWIVKSKKDLPFTITLTKVKCVIDKLDIHIKEAKHDIFDKIATTFFAGRIKKAIAQAIVDNIVRAIEPFNDRLNTFFHSHPIDRFTESANVQLKEAYTRGQEIVREEIAPRISEAAETVQKKAQAAAETIQEKAKAASETVQERAREAKEKWQEGLESPMEVEHTKEEWKTKEGKTQEKSEKTEFSLPARTYQPV